MPRHSEPTRPNILTTNLGLSDGFPQVNKAKARVSYRNFGLTMPNKVRVKALTQPFELDVTGPDMALLNHPVRKGIPTVASCAATTAHVRQSRVSSSGRSRLLRAAPSSRARQRAARSHAAQR